MGIFSKARDVKDADIAEMLAKSGDPTKLVRVIISEMEDTLVEARSTAVRALARRKELERTVTTLRAQATDWEQKAELALRKEREDLARGALAMKARTLGDCERLEATLPAVREQVARLDEDIGELRAKLADARSRQRMLALRGDAGASRRNIKEQLTEPRTARSDGALEQSAAAVDRIEAEAESYAMGDRSLAAQFARLETDGRVEAELAQLRQRLNKTPGGTPDGSDR